MQVESENKKGVSYLLTGGEGFIGSHTLVELYTYLRASKGGRGGWNIIALENFSNASRSVGARLETILKKEFPEDPAPYFTTEEADLRDEKVLINLFEKYQARGEPISCVIHFAAKKAVGESVQLPLDYYENNVVGTLNILRCIQKFSCRDFIFSSSATVYGCGVGVTEESPFSPDNPYGRTKVCVEFMLRDFARANKACRVLTLRYFNPCGAHSSGLIGDAPSVFPNNLFPYIEQVAIGKREHLNIFGKDYNTPDGTGVRDYLHVVDLAKGHVACLPKLETMTAEKNWEAYNLGTGRGYSVLEIVQAYEKAVGKPLNYKFVGRREGDVEIMLANVDKAAKELNWKAEKTMEEMCKDSYNFITKNPEGIK